MQFTFLLQKVEPVNFSEVVKVGDPNMFVVDLQPWEEVNEFIWTYKSPKNFVGQITREAAEQGSLCPKDPPNSVCRQNKGDKAMTLRLR